MKLTRPRRRWPLAVVVLLLLAATTVSWIFLRADTKARFDRIQAGMTLAEVETILDGPEGDYGNDIGLNIDFEGNLSHPRAQRTRVWYYNEGFANVLFDDKDRVLSTRWRENPLRLGIWDRLLQRLGFGRQRFIVMPTMTITETIRARPAGP